MAGDAGFTLVELLIVIAVLSALAAVVILALGGVTANAQVSACASDATIVQTAVNAYNAQTGGAPEVTEALLLAAPTP